MTVQTLTLADFLLARIAEDETAARAAICSSVSIQSSTAAMTHIGRWSSARVLAECEAKRQVVGEYAEYLSTVRAYRSPRWADAMNEQDKEDARQAEARHRVAEDVARLLALPYADHPDFREEWRP